MIVFPLVGLMSGIIGGAGAVIGAGIGAISSAIANRKQRQSIQQQRAENRDWYNRKSVEDYTQRTDAQAVVEKQRQLLADAFKNTRATAAVAGASDASIANTKEQTNDAVAKTTSGMAAQASSYKEGVENSYRQTESGLASAEQTADAQKAQAIAQAAGQVVAAGTQMVGAGVDKYLENQTPTQKQIAKIIADNAPKIA